MNFRIPCIKQIIPRIVIGDITPDYNNIFPINLLSTHALMLLHLGRTLFLQVADIDVNIFVVITKDDLTRFGKIEMQ